MSDDRPAPLVEHFFRHEAANLISVLTRAFGWRRLELVEDVVQAAMLQAMQHWRQAGVPDNPAAWIHRVARNRLLDALRREDTHAKALAHVGQSAADSAALIDEWLDEERLPDSLLRMIFVCCHPSLDRPSQIALTLHVLCGFSIAEVASGLLLGKEAAKKRVQRAKQRLAERDLTPELPAPEELESRRAAVLDVLYLMFNEGYSTSRRPEPIHDDLCEEAARLCHLLCEHAELRSPDACALLALMLFHAARLESRVDDHGATILLEEQDRSRWDRGLIGIAERWLARSVTDAPSHFHYEAAIAQVHCHAPSVEATNWSAIVTLYGHLLALGDSPLFTLNRAIARAFAGDLPRAEQDLDALERHGALADYALLDCTRARFAQLADDLPRARREYERALTRQLAPHEREVVERKLAALGG